MMEDEKQRLWLQKEAMTWENDGIINDAQLNAILSRYDMPKDSIDENATKKDGTSQTIQVMSILGALLVGVGAILFVAANWKELPTFAKLLLLFGTTYSTYFAGWNLKYMKATRPKLGESLLFLASLLIGATIFLNAQIFNVNADAHWLLLVWLIAILPYGYAFNSSSILFLKIFVFALWTIFYVGQNTELFVSSFGIFMFYLLLGINLYGLGQMHLRFERFSHFRELYQGSGLFFILISYFYFSLETPFRHTLTRITPLTGTLQALFILFMLISVIMIVQSALMCKKHENRKYEFIVLILTFTGMLAIWMLTIFKDSIKVSQVQDYGLTQLEPGIATLLFIFFNLMYFILTIGSILIGYYRSILSFVNIGMGFFMIGVLHLYFTTLYRSLPRSLAFIVGGLILLLFGGYMEKKRRIIINNIKEGDSA
ncbi:DUF2157 domain-containing protein [Methanolobus psychrotolerans]|uniref:DUF2157 domain-containing protein n=1 Tax=Methanolobus psychrotolerans TaxID=1874706 RepID=UPI000B918AC7|nr:DUF2157 domain-containing protein [Methanolobus psychrotolerans]